MFSGFEWISFVNAFNFWRTGWSIDAHLYSKVRKLTKEDLSSLVNVIYVKD